MYIPEGSSVKPYGGFFSAPVISVGWLGGKKEPVPTGVCPPEFLKILKSAKRVLLCRGFHVCELCEVDKASGNGEIWARTTDGAYYAMPAMVAHYIEAHGYCPPQHLMDNFERLVNEEEICSLERQATPEELLEIQKRQQEQEDLRVRNFAQQITDAEDARILKEIGRLFGESST